MPSWETLVRKMNRDLALKEKAAKAPPRPEGFEEGTYTLRVVLSSVSKPPVWRTLRVPSDIKLGKLHRALQAAFGWSDNHRHAFKTQPNVGFSTNPFFGKIGADGGISDARVLFQAVVVEGATFDYIYDFVDWWNHKITVQQIEGPDGSPPRIECIAGKGACPPENCGGPPGYRMIKDALKDPSHPQFGQIVNWLGTDTLDPNAFSLEETNLRLGRLR